MSITDTQHRAVRWVNTGNRRSSSLSQGALCFQVKRWQTNPLPVINLTDTDTQQAPMVGSCVSPEPKPQSWPSGLSTAAAVIPTFLHDLKQAESPRVNTSCCPVNSGADSCEWRQSKKKKKFHKCHACRHWHRNEPSVTQKCKDKS